MIYVSVFVHVHCIDCRRFSLRASYHEWTEGTAGVVVGVVVFHGFLASLHRDFAANFIAQVKPELGLLQSEPLW